MFNFVLCWQAISHFACSGLDWENSSGTGAKHRHKIKGIQFWSKAPLFPVAVWAYSCNNFHLIAATSRLVLSFPVFTCLLTNPYRKTHMFQFCQHQTQETDQQSQSWYYNVLLYKHSSAFRWTTANTETKCFLAYSGTHLFSCDSICCSFICFSCQLVTLTLFLTQRLMDTTKLPNAANYILPTNSDFCLPLLSLIRIYHFSASSCFFFCLSSGLLFIDNKLHLYYSGKQLI